MEVHLPSTPGNGYDEAVDDDEGLSVMKGEQEVHSWCSIESLNVVVLQLDEDVVVASVVEDHKEMEKALKLPSCKFPLQ